MPPHLVDSYFILRSLSHTGTPATEVSPEVEMLPFDSGHLASNTEVNWAWWHTSVIPAPLELRQEDFESEASAGFTGSSTAKQPSTQMQKKNLFFPVKPSLTKWEEKAGGNYTNPAFFSLQCVSFKNYFQRCSRWGSLKKHPIRTWWWCHTPLISALRS